MSETAERVDRSNPGEEPQHTEAWKADLRNLVEQIRQNAPAGITGAEIDTALAEALAEVRQASRARGR